MINNFIIEFEKEFLTQTQKAAILYQALESGIIDVDSVLDTLMATKKNRL